MTPDFAFCGGVVVIDREWVGLWWSEIKNLVAKTNCDGICLRRGVFEGIF